jgi:hypothetical protein
MKKPSKRNYPDAMHEAMDIPAYNKAEVDDGANPVKKKKKHEKGESKKFEKKEKRGSKEC